MPVLFIRLFLVYKAESFRNFASSSVPSLSAGWSCSAETRFPEDSLRGSPPGWGSSSWWRTDFWNCRCCWVGLTPSPNCPLLRWSPPGTGWLGDSEGSFLPPLPVSYCGRLPHPIILNNLSLTNQINHITTQFNSYTFINYNHSIGWSCFPFQSYPILQ